MAGRILIEGFSISNIKARKDFLEDIKTINQIASKWTNTEVILNNIKLSRGGK